MGRIYIGGVGLVRGVAPLEIGFFNKYIKMLTNKHKQ